METPSKVLCETAIGSDNSIPIDKKNWSDRNHFESIYFWECEIEQNLPKYLFHENFTAVPSVWKF